MFVFFAILIPIAAVCLAVSAGYFHSRRASLFRIALALLLSVGGLACAVISAVLFYRSHGAQEEWVENAFSMFFRFGSWTAAAATLVLTLSVFFAKKLSHRIMRYAVGILFPIGMVMLTALFATLCADPESMVHSYVRAFGAGCAPFPLLAFAAEEIRSIRADRIALAEKNKKSK